MKRVSDFIERIEIICSTIMMAAITSILFTSVLFRYFLNAPLYWANEASIFMMAWITFLGGSLGLKYHSQATISFIIDRFNEWNQIKMKIATYIVILIALAVLIYISYDWIFSLTDTKSSSMRIPMWIPYSSVPIGLTFAFIHLLGHFIDYIKQWRRGRGSV